MNYRKNKAVNFSTLKEMKSSPADYKLRLDFGIDESDPMKLGTLVHALLLEPDTVNDKYALVPDAGKKFTKGMQAEYLEANPGKILVREVGTKTSTFNWNKATKIADSVKSKTIFKRFMANVESVEQELYGECTETGLKLKGLLDIITDKPSLIDVKTTSQFASRMYNLKKRMYINQLAFYSYLAKLNGRSFEKQFVFFIETIHPFKVRLVEIDPRAIINAHEENIELLKRVKECTEMNTWDDGSDIIEQYTENE